MRSCFMALALSLALTCPAFAAAPTDTHTTIVAAYEGSAMAQYQLALMLMTGKGVEQDPKLAGSWFQCAANQGVTEAQYQLAQLELKNIAPGGKTAAYKWLLLSEGKIPERVELRKQVEADMQPELVSIIRTQAATWRPKVETPSAYVKGQPPACFGKK